MSYTPLAFMSDDELLRDVLSLDNPTDREVELADRLTYWKEYAEALLADADGVATDAQKEMLS